MNRPIKLSASVICADMLNLQRDLDVLQAKGMDYLHFDVMDGHFVPSVGLGVFVLEQLTSRLSIPVEVHLMVTDPLRYVEPLVRAGAVMITFHQECLLDPYHVLQEIKRMGVRAGLALRPGTSVSFLEPYLEMLDLVLLMAYSPGVRDQAPFPNFAAKVTATAALLDARGLSAVAVGVDGGVSQEYLRKYEQAGANFFVLGSTGLFLPERSLDSQVDAVRDIVASRDLA